MFFAVPAPNLPSFSGRCNHILHAIEFFDIGIHRPLLSGLADRDFVNVKTTHKVVSRLSFCIYIPRESRTCIVTSSA